VNQLVFDHLWQSTLFAILAGLTVLALKHHRANIRFCVWFSASLKFLIPFPLVAAFGKSLRWDAAPTLPMPSEWSDAMRTLAMPANVLPVAGDMREVASFNMHLGPILWSIWTCGVALLLARWIFHWRHLRAAAHDASPASIEAPIPILITNSPLGPGLVGIFRPFLLLPAGVVERLSSKQISLVVAHELCHWRRRDNLTGAIHMLVQTLFWFHPFVWWIGSHILAERERACDECVVASIGDPMTYAESILETCRLYARPPLPFASGVSGGNLKSRLERIMQNVVGDRLGMIGKTLLVVAATISISSPLLYGLLMPLKAAAQTQPAASSSLSDEEIAQKRAEQARPRTAIPYDPNRFDKFVGTYQHEQVSSIFFTISREGEHFYSRLTGQTNVEFFPESDTKFFAKIVSAQLSFNIDANGNITGLVLHQNGREQQFKRVDASVVKEAEAEIQRRIDENKPDMGRQTLLRREIEAEQRGEPDLEIMSPSLKSAADQQWPAIQETNRRLGKFLSFEFLHVDRRGWDIYEAKYEHGHGIWSVGPLTADHKLIGITFMH
jgi:beta-lactamase regulating signal transducer with metallopeptidase domain